MELLSRLDFTQFIRPPYLNERTACGINTLIEIKNLPIEKLGSVSMKQIRIKLAELANRQNLHLNSKGQLSVFLHYIIDRYNLSSEEKSEFVRKCIDRYRNFCLLGTLKLLIFFLLIEVLFNSCFFY